MPLSPSTGFYPIPATLRDSEAMSMKTQLQLEPGYVGGAERISVGVPDGRGDGLEACSEACSEEWSGPQPTGPQENGIFRPQCKCNGGEGRADGETAPGGGAEESDESVLRRLNAGEQRAMGKLWERYAGLLFSQALRVLHNPSEAEDVVVEVFSEVWRRAGGYHPERARPAAWLVTLVRRRAIDRFRERRSHERAEERMALERDCGPGCSCATEEQVRISELRRLLEQALNRLPERQREAVCMVYFEGLTQREISKRTRTPIGTIKTRLELGLRKMRERIRGGRVRPRTDCEAGEDCFSEVAEALGKDAGYRWHAFRG